MATRPTQTTAAAHVQTRRSAFMIDELQILCISVLNVFIHISMSRSQNTTALNAINIHAVQWDQRQRAGWRESVKPCFPSVIRHHPSIHLLMRLWNNSLRWMWAAGWWWSVCLCLWRWQSPSRFSALLASPTQSAAAECWYAWQSVIHCYVDSSHWPATVTLLSRLSSPPGGWARSFR